MSSGPPLKKLKKDAVKQVKQRYRKEYTDTYPVLLRSKVDDFHVYCTVCKTNKNISHGGISDCREHIESGKHQSNAQVQKDHSGGIDVLFKNAEAAASKKNSDVTRSELLFTNFLGEHNIPLAVSDHASPLFENAATRSLLAGLSRFWANCHFRG